MLQITLLYLLALTTGSFAAVAGQLRDGDSDVSLYKEECKEVCTETILCPLDCFFCVWPQSTKCCPGAGTPICVLPHTPPINLTLPDQGPNSLYFPEKVCRFLCPLQKPCPEGCKKCAWNPGFACCAFSGPPKCVDPISSVPTPISNVTSTTSSTKTRSSPTIPPTPTSPPKVTKRNYRPTSLSRKKRQDNAEIICPNFELPCPKECPKTCIRSKNGPCPNKNKPICPPSCPKIVVPCPKECPTKESGCVRPQGVLCPYAVEPTCKPTVTITVDPANPTLCPLVIIPCPEKCPDTCLRPVGVPCPNIYPPWCPGDSTISVSATTAVLSTPTA